MIDPDDCLSSRALVLLKACRDMLKKADRSPFVLNVMEETVFYDDADCDGSCLLNDIETLLEVEGEVLE